jgi:hypothetical protein
MPIKKYRRVEDMEERCWFEPGDPKLWEALRNLARTAALAGGLQFPPGVYKHRSIADAERLRHEWEHANVLRRGRSRP